MPEFVVVAVIKRCDDQPSPVKLTRKDMEVLADDKLGSREWKISGYGVVVNLIVYGSHLDEADQISRREARVGLIVRRKPNK